MVLFRLNKSQLQNCVDWVFLLSMWIQNVIQILEFLLFVHLKSNECLILLQLALLHVESAPYFITNFERL